MSSSVPIAGQRRSRAMPMTQNYVRTTGYASSPHGSYVFVSPVLLPCVEQPARYGKGKPKRGKKASAKVRYVPALVSQPAIVYNNGHYYPTNPAPTAQPQAPEPYPAQPYAMSINPDNHRFKHGYVSALTTPTTTYYLSDQPPTQALQSDLNPLSRPYTPSVRSKSGIPAPIQQYDESCWSQSAVSSQRSSPELWGDSVSTVTSRAPTPSNSVCFYCGLEKQPNLSDTDSGVGGETDEEGYFCSCDVTSTSFDSPRSSETDFFKFRFKKNDVDSIPKSTSVLIDTLCSNLHSYEWRTVARELGLDEVIIMSADYDVFANEKEQMKSVFCVWAKLNESVSQQSICKQVQNALQEIGRFDLIELISTQL